MMTKHVTRSRSFAPVLLALVAAFFFGTTNAAHAQDGSSGEQPEYAQQFNDAMATAREGQQMEGAGDMEGAVENYTTAYRSLAEVIDMAKEAGSVERANQAQDIAAKLAYKSGMLMHNDGQSEAAIEHFEFGQQIAPPSFTQNTSGLQAARRKLQSAPVAEASELVNQGNYGQAIQRLSEIEEQTGTTYFYTAIAHNRLNNTEQAVAYAGRALEAGGLSSTRQGQMYLIVGEGQLRLGDEDAARSALERAVDLGSSSVQQSAQYSLDQM